MAPDCRACARSARQRIQADVLCAPHALHLWAGAVEQVQVIVEPPQVERPIGKPPDERFVVNSQLSLQEELIYFADQLDALGAHKYGIIPALHA